MNKDQHSENQTQVLMSSQDLIADMDFFTKVGFRLEQIFPADDPTVAVMSGHGIYIRIDKTAECPSPILFLMTNEVDQIVEGRKEITAPNGTQIKIQEKDHHLEIPKTHHKFEVRKLQDGDPWVIGRAGMLYRDLIPDRLGGSIIASHIRIPNGGPVPDMVHYHTIGFQLIFCYKGWVKLVYEDQGPPFILKAGDCVTQPPEIRHRVLESSDNLEVIEIGVPAEHITTIDHDLKLPTAKYLPNREFQGQIFCHHLLENAIWKPWKVTGFEYRETGIKKATQGVASVQVIRNQNEHSSSERLQHDANIYFTFVMEGAVDLDAKGQEPKRLNRGDAFVIPPGLDYHLNNSTEDLELLEVSIFQK